MLCLQVFEDATIKRVDSELGLLCELPAPGGSGSLTPGYAHISAIADEKVETLDKVGISHGNKLWELVMGLSQGTWVVSHPCPGYAHIRVRRWRCWTR